MWACTGFDMGFKEYLAHSGAFGRYIKMHCLNANDNVVHVNFGRKAAVAHAA